MNIVFQADDQYVPYLSVAIISLLENNKDKFIRIFVFDAGIQAENADKLRDMCKPYNCLLKFLEVSHLDDELEKYNLPRWRGSLTIYYKLFAADILDDCDRILILDADVAIAGSISELFELNINSTIAMVQEPMFSGYNKFLDNKKQESYYSAGTILIDAKKWREGGYQKKIIDYIIVGNQLLMFPEQDILCTLFIKEIYKLPPKFNRLFKTERFSDALSLKILGYSKNQFYSKDEILDSVNHTVIYHFDDRLSGRPWEADNTHPFTKVFDHYLLMTPWKGIEKKQVDRKRTFIIQQKLVEVFPFKIGCWLQLLLLKLDYKLRIERLKSGKKILLDKIWYKI